MNLNGIHDEQVPDDRDDQLGAPVAATEKSILLFSLIIIFSSYAKYIRRDRQM